MSEAVANAFRRRQRQRTETLIATLTALVVEGLLTIGLGFLPALWPVWLVLHLALAGGLFWWARGLIRRRRALRYPTLLVIATATLGLAGVLGACFAAAARRAYRSEARSFQHWYFTLFPARVQRKARAWYDLSRALGDEGTSAVESFADLIRFGDIDQKLAIVALLARRFEPRFAPVLKAALQDPDASVRVQAATAAAHIEDAFVERWMRTRREANARAGDARPAHDLARLLDDYAFAGILDERREAELRLEAEARFRQALESAPHDAKVRIGLGRLLIRLGRHQEAMATLEPLAANPTPDAAAWLMECYFRLGRYGDLARLCRKSDLAAMPEALADAARVWGDKPAPAFLATAA